jgi:hypothetical protein
MGMEGMVKMVIYAFAFGGFSTSSKESVRVGIKIYFKCSKFLNGFILILIQNF